jgi:hypothetical protein
MGIVAAVLLLVTIYCGSDVLAPFEARLFHHCYRLVCGLGATRSSTAVTAILIPVALRVHDAGFLDAGLNRCPM